MLKELKILLQKYFGTSSRKPTRNKKAYTRKGRRAAQENKLFSRGD